MAIGLPDLVVGLGLDTKKFSAGLSSAQKMMGGFASAAKSAILPVTAAFAAATGGAYLLQGRISKLAGVADQAVRTGLSGEFLQRLEYAADQSGVSVETLTTSIKKLTLTIGQNKKGFEDLQGLSPEKAFLEVARRISEIPTASGRAAASMKYFGRSGADMATLFAGGMNDVNKLLAEAKTLGIGLSDEALKKAADADDSIQRMYASFGAMSDQVAIGIAPLFEEIAKTITSWVPPVTKFFEEMNKAPEKMEFVKNAMIVAFDAAIAHMKTAWSDMWTSFPDVAANQLGLTKEQLVLILKAPLVPIAAPLQMLAAPMRAEGMIAEGIGGMFPGAAQQNVAAAGRAAAPRPAQFVGPQEGFEGVLRNFRAAGAQGRFNEGLKKFGDSLLEPAADLKTKLQQKGAELGLQANWWGSVVSQMFTGERPKEEAKPQQSLRLAGAMSRGSSEAYSVIANAMARTRDPVVNATVKTGDKIVDAINKKATIAIQQLEAFLP